MRLSDNDIRDITHLLEDGKPLDEKYRFIRDGVVVAGGDTIAAVPMNPSPPSVAKNTSGGIQWGDEWS